MLMFIDQEIVLLLCREAACVEDEIVHDRQNY
jgi:hypothetical protein